MREFTFTIEYGDEGDPITEVFRRHPELVAHSIDSCVTRDRFWRVERVSGPREALDAVEERRFDDDVCGESLTDDPCRAVRYHDVLERSPTERVLYTYLDGIRGCASVHTIAARCLAPGLLFETRRRGDRHHWRVLARSGENFGCLFDALSSRLRDGLSVTVGHVGDADGWTIETLAGVTMPDDQRTALRAAVERGYYRTPRETTIEELAEALEVPESTLSYRLRQAEAKLAEGFVRDRPSS